MIDILGEGLSAAQTGLRPRPTAAGIRLFTPRQLKDVLRLLLRHQPEMIAYLVMVALPKNLPRQITSRDLGSMVTYNVGAQFQRDLMMAFDKIRAVFPEEIEKGAEALAWAFCMMPSLRHAKQTYRRLGESYTDDTIDERSVSKLNSECLIPEGTVTELPNGLRKLGRDQAIRDAVADKLRSVNQDVADLFAT